MQATENNDFDDVVPERFFPGSIIITKKVKKQNSAYLAQVADVLALSDVATFMKLNYKCKAGTVDEGNSCPDNNKNTIKEINSSIINKPKIINLDESPTFKKEITELTEFYKTGRREVAFDFSDPILGGLSKETGFDGKPTTVSKTDIDNSIQSGSLELLRGISEPKYADAFRDGDYYPGRGVWGSGTYTAYGENAISVASKFVGFGSGGVVMRMSIDKNSNIITTKDLVPLQEVAISDIDNIIKREEKTYRDKIHMLFSRTDDTVDSDYEKIKADWDNKKMVLETKKQILSDPGKFAMLNGYDAIDIQESKFLLVLNRSVLYVQKEDLSIDTIDQLLEAKGEKL